ncbi:MAG TPA: hypothetical protein VIY47_16680 [Ignavibacteriaceae bacterium]
MANKSQKPSNGNNGNEPKLNKKKAFEQGTGNNNTTAEDSRLKDNADLKNQNDMNMDFRDVDRRDKRDQSKITNEDRKITNQDQPVKNKKTEHTPMDDDSDIVSQKSDPEIDPPHTDPERTEKKLPQMKK